MSMDWLGADQQSVVPAMIDGRDVEERTLEHQRRREDLETDGERIDKATDRVTELLESGTFEGTAERGSVTVVVDAQGRLVDVRLTPRAIHLGSTERVRAAILDAYDDALQTVADRLEEESGTTVPFSPLDAFIDAIPEVREMLPHELRHPPRLARPEPPDPEPDDEDDGEERAP